MDTLSSSISTFTLPKSNLNNRRRPSFSSSTSTTTTKPKATKLSNKTTTFTTSTTHHNFLPPHINSSRPSSPLKHSSSSSSSSPAAAGTHRRASTGYAVALLDAARRHNAADAVRRDVKRLSKWLRDDQLRRVMVDPSVDAAAKGEIVKEVVRQGGFEKHLVKLVRLLAEKGKVDLVGQVLSEFGKIYDELSSGAADVNDQTLLLPCGVKMEGNQILEIVGRIRKLTGADKVTVIDPNLGITES